MERYRLYRKFQTFIEYIAIFLLLWGFIYVGGKAIFGLSFFRAFAIAFILVLLRWVYKVMGKLGKPGI